MPPAWREHPKHVPLSIPNFPMTFKSSHMTKGPDGWGRQAELLWVRVTGAVTVKRFPAWFSISPTN